MAVKKTLPKKTKEAKEIVELNTVSFFVNRDEYASFEDTDILRLKKAFNVSITFDGDKFLVTSSNIKQCRKAVMVLERIFAIIHSGYAYTEDDVTEFIRDLNPAPLADSKYKAIYTTAEGVEISPRTEKQDELIQSIIYNTISVIQGAAGCGKTLMSLALGLHYLQSNRFDKIVIFRPTVSLGSTLGFFPGSVDEKTENYYGPIAETFISLLGEKTYDHFLKTGRIIYSPISMMRGANLDNYIVIEEAQNLSQHEMISLLTRINPNSKVVINGDISQSDRKSKDKSGLEYCLERLIGIESINIVKLSKKDIQRHKLVSEIIDAFED